MIPIPLAIVGLSGALFRTFHGVTGVTPNGLVLATSQQKARLATIGSATLTFFSDLVSEVIAPFVCIVLAIRAILAVYEWLERRRMKNQHDDSLLAHLQKVDLVVFHYDKTTRTVTIGTIQKNPFAVRVNNFPTDQILYPSKMLGCSFSWNFFCVCTVHEIWNEMRSDCNLVF